MALIGINCEYCSRPFMTEDYLLKRGRGRFCSRRCAQRGKYGSVEKRFWLQVARTEDDLSCWLWLGAKDSEKEPYGRFSIDGISKRANRVSYELFVGPIPEGLQVLHKCDNMQCVRPSHLYAGTNQDNMDDKVTKSRQARLKGQLHGNSKLTDELVIHMRKQHSIGVSYKTLAQLAGVSPGTVYHAVTGRTWGHIIT